MQYNRFIRPAGSHLRRAWFLWASSVHPLCSETRRQPLVSEGSTSKDQAHNLWQAMCKHDVIENIPRGRQNTNGAISGRFRNIIWKMKKHCESSQIQCGLTLKGRAGTKQYSALRSIIFTAHTKRIESAQSRFCVRKLGRTNTPMVSRPTF